MKKFLLLILISPFAVYGQHNGVEKKFFPEEEYEINTPAFQKNKFTNYKY